jgi:type II secretory pathway predicted ATPase ExeA
MNKKKLHALYGLKWNPFTPDVPIEGLFASKKVESFCARVESMVDEGGFALVTGDPGQGKSITLRLLADRLTQLPEVTVGVLTRPQSGIIDFYRELGDLFAVNLKPHNRWGGFKALRERWRAHTEASLLRPVLLVDEGQEMTSQVLSELRILAAGKLDVEMYLTIVLAGDHRLLDRFRQPDLLPLGSRIRTRLVLEYAGKEELKEVFRHTLKAAGSANLLSPPLQDTLIEHAAGNFRVLMAMAGELLMIACERNLAQIDEKLFFELYETRAPKRSPRKKQRQ